MVKKKPFIDRKTAQHFHVVHRSQRDPRANDPEASKYVLLSSKQQVEYVSDEDDADSELSSDDDMPDLIDEDNETKEEVAAPLRSALKASVGGTNKAGRRKKAQISTRRVRFGLLDGEDFVDELGMKKDGYDYSQHMKEMGHGRFYSATSNDFVGHNALTNHIELPEDALPSAHEEERQLEAITLTAESMDADLRRALMDDDTSDQFEELNDDFVVQAATEVDDEDDEQNGLDGFDYEAHIAKLMAAASGVPKYKGNLTDDEDEDDEEDEFEEDDEDDEMNAVDRTEQQRVLDEQFEQLMAEEYDDEHVGDLEAEEEATQGNVVLEGELLDTIVDDLREIQQELLDDEGKVGNPLRTGNHLAEIREACAKEREGEDEDEDDATTDEDDPARVEQELRELFERNAYLRPREQEKWDCETIVSTYSNMDNHPTVLHEERTGRKKSKAKKVTETAVIDPKVPIVLSKKTGIPLGVLEERPSARAQEAEPAEPSPASLLPTKVRGESKAEKKARKEAIKAFKQQRRQEKKQWKTAFKDEEQRQAAQTQGGQVSIFKYA